MEKTMGGRRDFLGGLAGLGLAGVAAGCAAPGARRTAPRAFALGPKNGIDIPVAGLAQPVRFVVAGDTHLALHDARDDDHADNYRRMAQYPGERDALARTLARARKDRADLVLLVGDIISFPSLANVDHLTKTLAEGGVDWTYTAGNHDWHFEGDAGTDAEQRDRWIARRLLPLYRGANPLMHSRVVKGVRFVMIDNSEYDIRPDQLAFWRQEAAKGEPVVLGMHIPLWTKTWGLMTCGSPDWGTANDPYWQIERRQRWASRPSEVTFAFRREILATPNLVGVFTGHHHRFLAAQTDGQLMFSTPTNRLGDALTVSLASPETEA